MNRKRTRVRNASSACTNRETEVDLYRAAEQFITSKVRAEMQLYVQDGCCTICHVMTERRFHSSSIFQ